jgi:hypothetical protein
MRKALYLLTSIPVFLTAAIILVEVVFLPVVFFWLSREHTLRDASRVLLTAVIGAAIATACLIAGRRAEDSRKAVIGCLLVSCTLILSGLYLAYNFAHNPLPPAMRSEGVFGFLLAALPELVFGLMGLIGSIGLLRVPAANQPETT